MYIPGINRADMKIKTILIIWIILIIMTGDAFSQGVSSSAYKLTQVLSNINNYYVENVDSDKIVDNAIAELLMKLDPHSQYFTKQEAEKLMRTLDGSFEGVGLTYSIPEDTIYIISTVPDGPSDIAGLLPGDRIVKIDNELVAGVKITDDIIRDFLLGKSGTKVNVSIKRKGSRELIPFVIIRDEIQTGSISASYIIQDNIGFIRLERFSQNSDNEFADSLKVLKKKGAEHLIIDLRGNTGGYLRACVNIIDNFLDSRKLIVTTKGENSRESSYESSRSGLFHSGRIVILTNENSASASEIVAGSVQDLDRGIVMGKRTYGKGLVQRPFYLNDGSLMRLTVARYYTPSGRCIQKMYGISADDYQMEISNRAYIEQRPDSGKVYFTLNKREVYGGGGIFPDIYVPSETEIYSQFYKEFLNTGIIFDRVYIFSDNFRKSLKGLYSSCNEYLDNYKINDIFIKDLLAHCPDSILQISKEQDGQKFNLNDRHHLKALISGNLWGNQFYYKALNTNSKLVTEAVSVILDDIRYKSILQELTAETGNIKH